MANNQLTQVLAAIDHVNCQDPNRQLHQGEMVAKQLRYGQLMSACLAEHWPEADELLQIAVRAQHIKRWQLKRSEFAEGKAGYLQWRKALAQLHAQLTQEIMQQQGYSLLAAQQTGAIIRKQQLKQNIASQTLEDVACLVFLQHYLAEFAQQHDEQKIITILRKTWNKMSAKGQDLALTLQLDCTCAKLLANALKE
jgi:hypothetical protein